jgi:acetolactate synthase-1/2/3 large subunit
MGEIIARAIRIAESGTPGPVVVSLPTDVLGAPCTSGPIARRTAAVPRAAGSDTALVAQALAEAARPVMIVGGRVDSPAARRALLAVSEAWSVPVFPTYVHQDVFPNEHPNYGGELGIRPPDTVAASVLEADLILAVGTRMGALASVGERVPTAGQRVIHVYPDENQIGVGFDVHAGIVSDAGAFLAALAERNAPEPSAARAAWLRRVHAGYTDFASQLPRPAADGVDFGHVIQAMKHTVPDDAVITVDAGSFASWLHLTYPFKPTQMLLGSECGAMGMSIPAAVAAAIRHPERQVVAVVGDGGALMSGYELATAVGRGVRNLRVIIANNNAYGTIRFHQETHFPGRPQATDLVNPDFAMLAAAFGARGFVIDRAEAAQEVLREAMAHPGVAVIEARTSLENVDAKNTIAQLRARVGEAPGMG